MCVCVCLFVRVCEVSFKGYFFKDLSILATAVVMASTRASIDFVIIWSFVIIELIQNFLNIQIVLNII